MSIQSVILLKALEELMSKGSKLWQDPEIQGAILKLAMKARENFDAVKTVASNVVADVTTLSAPQFALIDTNYVEGVNIIQIAGTLAELETAKRNKELEAIEEFKKSNFTTGSLGEIANRYKIKPIKGIIFE
jgi:hypothetical protein